MKITSEHRKIAAENGISSNALWRRVNTFGWDIEEAISHPIGKMRDKTRKKISKSHIFTDEQLKKAEELGLNRNTMWFRVRSGMTPEEAVTTPLKRYRVFTEEQIKKAEELGIKKKTLYSRIYGGMTPEQAVSIKVKPRERTSKNHDWDKELYALYKGDTLLADGTVYEIAEKLNMSASAVKHYGCDSVKERIKYGLGNSKTLVYLGNEDDEEWDGDE